MRTKTNFEILEFLLREITAVQGFSNHKILRALKNAGFSNVFEVLGLSKQSLLSLPNISKASLSAFELRLNEYGFKLEDTKKFIDDNKRSLSGNISLSDYKNKIQEFLDKRKELALYSESLPLSAFNGVSLVDFFPDEAKQKLSHDFLIAVTSSPEVISSVRQILVKAVQQNLTFSKI